MQYFYGEFRAMTFRTLGRWIGFVSVLTCVAGSAFALEPVEMQWPIKRLGPSNIQPRPGDPVLTLRATGSEWVIDMAAALDQPDVERLWFRRIDQSGHIVVLAKTYHPAPETGRSLCSYGALGSAPNNRTDGYTECNSAFFKCAITLADALLIVPSIVTATRVCPMQLDASKVKSAIQSANVGGWLQAFQDDQRLQSYRSAFAGIRTSRDAEQFGKSFESYDPEGLVGQAKQKGAALLVIEGESAQRQNLELDQQRQEQLQKQLAQEKAEAIQQRLLAESARKAEELRSKRTRDFRKRLVLGSNTFCGPVINLRGPMVQIAVNAPLPGYNAEPWLKLDDVYPADVASCRNVNGRLEPMWAE